MEKVLLNSDLLNDADSIYFQIDKFEFIKFKMYNIMEYPKFFVACYKDLAYRGIKHKSLFVPISIYNNVSILISNNPIFKDTDTFETILSAIGINEKNLIIYTPDVLKDKFKHRQL